MSDPIRITLRGEPEGRKQPAARAVRRKIDGKSMILFYPAKETAAYQRALAMQARVVMGSRALLSGAVAVNVVAVMPVPRSWSTRKRDAALAGMVRPTGKPDWDNIGKQMDAFKGVVWMDDAIVVDCRVIKVYGEEPKLNIEIKSLEEGPLL